MVMAVADASLQTLAKRFDALEARLSRAEQRQKDEGPRQALFERQEAILQRIAALETGSSGQAPTAALDTPPVPNGESETYRKLHSELARRGCRGYRFVRVPVPYYEKPLEFRAERVGAASKDHLCKTMVMENTRAPDDVTDCSNPKLSKYYMVLVQYSAAIDAEKLKAFVHKLYNEVRPVSKSKVNLRMVPEEVAHELTGFGHNAVTPVCSATRIPIVVSHRIAQLSDRFFLGAGEVDLKVGMPPDEFVRGFQDWPAWVVDCTAASAA